MPKLNINIIKTNWQQYHHYHNFSEKCCFLAQRRHQIDILPEFIAEESSEGGDGSLSNHVGPGILFRSKLFLLHCTKWHCANWHSSFSSAKLFVICHQLLWGKAKLRNRLAVVMFFSTLCFRVCASWFLRPRNKFWQLLSDHLSGGGGG